MAADRSAGNSSAISNVALSIRGYVEQLLYISSSSIATTQQRSVSDKLISSTSVDSHLTSFSSLLITMAGALIKMASGLFGAVGGSPMDVADSIMGEVDKAKERALQEKSINNEHDENVQQEKDSHDENTTQEKNRHDEADAEQQQQNKNDDVQNGIDVKQSDQDIKDQQVC